MPIDYPSSPTVNQIYTYNGKAWVFNGTAWVGAGFVGVNASSANTASYVVQRDASGNFAAGTITAALIGNATTATSATTAGTITSQANSATIAAASANTASAIVLRDASGNFSAGTITATLTGNATNVTGIVAIANGGTGQITANAAVNALLPAQASNSGKYLTSNGTDSSWGAVVSGTTIPPASMQMYAGVVTQSASAGVVTTTAPSGWLLCDGAIVSRTTYSALWTALGTTSSPYGQGDGSTTFALPDMRSKVPIGVGTGSGLTARTLGGTVGVENTTLATTNLPSHDHAFTPSGSIVSESGHVHASANAGWHAHASNNSVLLYVGGGGGANLNAGTTWQAYNMNATMQGSGDHNHGNTNYNSGHTHGFTGSAGTTGASGSGSSFTNMPPSIGLNYLIKI